MFMSQNVTADSVAILFCIRVCLFFHSHPLLLLNAAENCNWNRAGMRG